MTPGAIEAKLTPKMRAALMDLQPTLDVQDQPRHKGNHSSALCFLTKRTIAQDCYAELGSANCRTNPDRKRPTDSLYIHTWRFTKLGLAVRKIVSAHPMNNHEGGV